MSRAAGRRRHAVAGLVAAALLAACMAAASPARAAADVPVPDRGGTPSPPVFLGEVITESRVLYPLLVEGWIAESEHRYAEQREGVSVRYIDNRKRRWIDVYFYPAGVQSAQSLARLAGGERDGIAGAARQAGRAVDMGTLESFTLAQAGAGAGAGGAALPAWRLGLAYPDDTLASAMVLFAHGLYLVKARASAAQPPATVESLQAEVEKFMASVATQLRIVNTGACWLPERTDIASALPPTDSDEVLASYRDPGRDVAAVVVGDRVRVAQAEAGRAPLLAARLAEALYPGCVAPETINPEVPPSLREIRIEYRVPAAGEGPPRGPWIGRPRSPVLGTG